MLEEFGNDQSESSSLSLRKIFNFDDAINWTDFRVSFLMTDNLEQCEKFDARLRSRLQIYIRTTIRSDNYICHSQDSRLLIELIDRCRMNILNPMTSNGENVSDTSLEILFATQGGIIFDENGLKRLEDDLAFITTNISNIY